MTAETDEGGLRYAILARLDGREFERIQLDIDAVPDDQRPLERLELRDLLDFAGIAPPSIPVIPVAQHLAEKLRATCRETFALRQTNWPPAMPAPPTTWIAAWESYVRDHDVP